MKCLCNFKRNMECDDIANMYGKQTDSKCIRLSDPKTVRLHFFMHFYWHGTRPICNHLTGVLAKVVYLVKVKSVCQQHGEPIWFILIEPAQTQERPYYSLISHFSSGFINPFWAEVPYKWRHITCPCPIRVQLLRSFPGNTPYPDPVHIFIVVH